MPLITFTDKGLFCETANIYIDPWKPVQNAVITHAHSDHARWGSEKYLCHKNTLPLLKLRLGEGIYQAMEYGNAININGVNISFHPAGHVFGSAQIRLEHKGEIWVVSGDYKLQNDGISAPFEPVTCNVFITESTFGLPIFNWKNQQEIYNEINQWISENQQEKINSVLFAYSLGKAQRVLNAVAETTTDVFVHGAVFNVNECIQTAHCKLPFYKKAEQNTIIDRGSVIIAPPSAAGSPWLKKFTPYKTAVCSGWMQIKGNFKRQQTDKAFVLSDHADWNDLLYAIKATQAEKVMVTHGFQAQLVRYLNENGTEAFEVKTEFGNESDENI